MHTTPRLLAFTLALIVCGPLTVNAKVQPAAALPASTPRIKAILDTWHDPNNNAVLVVAHRGAHRGARNDLPYGQGLTAPENSIPAIEDAIALGCDMVELDVRRTADGVLVLMHDTTIDRTTTGTGKIAETTHAELRTHTLVHFDGTQTDLRAPTLEEALLACRGRILVNLDKTGPYMAECLALAENLGMANHVVLKARVSPEKLPTYLADRGLASLALHQSRDTVIFMPITDYDDESPTDVTRQLSTYLDDSADAYPAIEVCFRGADAGDRLIAAARRALDGRSRFWMNSLWDNISGGRSDAAAANDPDAVWGWMIDHGVQVIQTDEPKLCLEYLRRRGVRP